MRPRLVTLVALLSALICLAAAPAQANTISATCTSGAVTGPCSSAWYTAPVTVTWQADPAPTSVAPCQLGIAIPFTTDTPEPVGLSCTAYWTDGSSAMYGFLLHVEITPPSATATADRPPDSEGWYNHPVNVSFAGTAVSGIASCSPTTTYSGPTAVNATISGTCTDNAGKTANASLSLNYDAAPPVITGAEPSRPPDSGGFYTRPVSFTFKGSDGTSGIAGCDSVTYRGPTSGSVVGGCHDRAGNYATITVPVRYRAPAVRASITRVHSSIVLRWKSARHASYYNVQVYRAGTKVLSTWPAQTSLRLRRAWKYAGHRYRLKPGRYRWYVWPGYGNRAAARYGRMLVSGAFRVTRP